MLPSPSNSVPAPAQPFSSYGHLSKSFNSLEFTFLSKEKKKVDLETGNFYLDIHHLISFRCTI